MGLFKRKKRATHKPAKPVELTEKEIRRIAREQAGLAYVMGLMK